MVLQQAHPYDTGPYFDPMKALGDVRQNQLADLNLELSKVKAQRASQVFNAQQQLYGQIQDPNKRLAAMIAPEKYAESQFPKNKDNFGQTEHGVWDYSTNPPKFIPRPKTGLTDAYGRPLQFGSGAPQPTPAPGGGGAGGNLASLDVKGFRDARRRFEGGTSGSAPPNPNSSAQGPDQFIESTWERLMLSKGRAFIDMKIGPNADTNDPKVKAAIQALRNDDEVSASMAEEYARENAAELQQGGFDPSHRNLTLAHFLGGGGAKRLLSAQNPNDPAAAHVDPAAVKANQNVFFDKATGRPRTVAEVLAEVDRRIGEVSPQQAGASPPAGGQGVQVGAQGTTPPLTAFRDEDGKLNNDFGIDAQGRLWPWPGKGNTTNVNVGEKTGDQVGTTQRWKSFGEYRQRGETAVRLQPKLAMLREQLTTLQAQGPGSGTLYAVAGTAQNLARTLGVDQATIDLWSKELAGVDTKSVEGAAFANKLIQDFVTTSLRSAFAGMGATTDNDMAAILKSNASLENPLAANLRLIDEVFSPALERDKQLWARLRPMQQRDRELMGLDDEVAAFDEAWNAQHYPPKPAAPPADTATPDPNTPPAEAKPPAPATDEAAIRAKYPGAIKMADGRWAAKDPTSSTGYRVIVQ